MPLYAGDALISGVYFGGTPITAVYHGEDQIWPTIIPNVIVPDSGTYVITGAAADLIRVDPLAGFPKIESTSNGDTAGTATADANLPSGIQAGDMLVAVVGVGGGSLTVPSGWNQRYTAISLVVQRQSVFYRVADGSEGATLSLTSSSAQIKNYAIYRISNYQDTPEGASANASSGDADPPNFAPSWGSAKTLWLAIAKGSVSGLPTNYGNALNATNFKVGHRYLEAASENPGTFSMSTSTFWTAGTIAVRGA